MSKTEYLYKPGRSLMTHASPAFIWQLWLQKRPSGGMRQIIKQSGLAYQMSTEWIRSEGRKYTVQLSGYKRSVFRHAYMQLRETRRRSVTEWKWSTLMEWNDGADTPFLGDGCEWEGCDSTKADAKLIHFTFPDTSLSICRPVYLP